MPMKNERVKSDKNSGWCVYILECRNDTLYTGLTNDLKRRFEEHLKRTSRYTSYNPPVRIVYHEPLRNRSLAAKREARIKALTRKQKLALIAARLEGRNRPKNLINSVFGK